MDAARFQEPRRRMIPIQSPWGDGEMAVLDFGDPGRPVDVVFVHANGFNAMTYRSILAPLSASLRIVAPDLRGHGATRLPADPRGRKNWSDYRDDLCALLDELGGPPVTLAGHSMGGTAALLAAAKRPQRVSNLVMFDPVIWSRLQSALLHLPGAQALGRARAPIARTAARRRSVFDSRADAFAAYKGRGAFKSWPETVLADYVAGGFAERPDGGVELACSPAWETSNFVSQANHTWAALAQVRRPVRILRAPNSVTCHVGDAKAFRRRLPHATVETVEGSHFFPMERPDLVRDAVLDAAV